MGAAALRECDDRGVGAAEREVGVLLDESGDAMEVFAGGTFDVESPHAGQKRGFGCRAEAAADEVGGLGHDEGGHDEAQVATREDVAAGFVMIVVGIGGCVRSR